MSTFQPEPSDVRVSSRDNATAARRATNITHAVDPGAVPLTCQASDTSTKLQDRQDRFLQLVLVALLGPLIDKRHRLKINCNYTMGFRGFGNALRSAYACP